MRLGKFAHTRMSRATSWLLTFALLFTMVPTFVLVNPEPAAAAEVITNGTFTGSAAGWTNVEIQNPTHGIIVYSSTVGNPAGSVQHLTDVNVGNGRNQNWIGESTQTISTTITAGSNVNLGLWWRKQRIELASLFDISIDIRKPSGAIATIWSDTSIPADGTTVSTTVTPFNVSSYFTETGRYEIRLISHLTTPGSGKPEALVWWDNVSLDVLSNQLTVGNATDPASATVIRGDTSKTVDAFSLQTNSGTNAVTAISILGSASTTSGAVSAAKVYKDNNSDGLLNGGDTLQGTGTFSGTTATVSGLSIVASTTVQNYVVAYDIASGAAHNAALTGRVTSVTAGYTKIYNDTSSATLTVDAASPNAVSSFLATDGKDARVPLSWVNPSGETTFAVRVLRRTGQYPINATDTVATNIYDATGTEGASVNIIDTGRTNGQTYYYAAFTRDQYLNWNNTVTAGTTADTGTPNAVMLGDSASAVTSATVKGGDLNQEAGVFTLRATADSDTVTTMTVTGSVDTTQGSVATARIFSDAGTLGVLDGGDTTVASAAFSGSAATFTGLTLNVNTTTANYLITYDIAAAPVNGAKLTAYVSTATASAFEVMPSTDTADATLTVDSAAPGTATGFTASDAENQQSSLAWTNPVDADLAEVKVVRKEGSYPTAHDDAGGTVVLDDTAAPFDTAYLNTGLTNGTTYFYAAFTKDTVGNWNNTVTAGTTADTGTPSLPAGPTTTIGDGSPGFGNTTVGRSYNNQAVDAFTLRTSVGTDTITSVTVTGGGGTGSTNVSAARLFSDAGTVGILDVGDTTITASTFSGNTVTFSSLNLAVSTSTTNYLVAYSIAAGASNNAKLDGYVSSVTASGGNAISKVDTIDATLTVDAQAPGSITGFNAADFGNTTSSLSWVNPGDADLAEIKVVRKTGSYPTAHTDGTVVVDDTVGPFDTSFNDTGLINGTKYYYAGFAQDSYANWNSAVVEGTNADTATPQVLAVTFGNNTQDASGTTFYHGQIDRLMQSFTLVTNGANGNWTQIGLSEYGSGTAASNVAQVRIFRDDGDSGFDAGDTELTTSPNTFTGENTTFTITGGETLTSASREYFIVYDMADGATPETTVTVASRLAADGSIIVTSGTVSGINPAKSSGTATLYSNTVTVTGLDTAPSPTVAQGFTNDFLRLALTTNFGTANWTSVTVDRTGTAADSDVAAVKIFKSTNTTWEESDTQIGSGTFSGGSSAIDITDQTISTAITDYYFVVYAISGTADVSKTVGARVDSSGTITLAAPDGIGAFSFGSGAPEIEESNNDTSAPTPPTNLTATSTVASQVSLAWTAASDPESGISWYRIYRSYESFDATTYGTDALLIATIAPATAYTDTTATGLITGEDYWYAVSAVNGAGLASTISNVATVTVSGKEAPHYDFATTTNKCRICHKLHGSPARAKVFRKFPEIQICFTCHDGTGSDYNIQQKWTDSAHDGTETALYTADTFIQCVKCHNPHGADPDYGTPYFLQRRVEENLCFRCHSSTGFTPVASKNGWYIEEQMTSSVTVSRHAVVSTTTKNGQGYYPEGTATTADGLTGARVECTSCHNAMVSQRGTLGTSFLVRLIDPFNVWNLWQDNSRSVAATFVNFCLNCHNSTATPIKTASATTIVPYTVAFPSMSTTDYPFFFGWDKVAYRDSTSAHNVNAVICGNCHNPHGSKNQRLMAFGYDANTATPAWDFYYDDSTSTAREQRLCYQCHRAAGRAGFTSAPDVETQFSKTYSMPVNTTDLVHRDTETSVAFSTANRHVECYDCHDPHKAKSGMRGKNNLAGGPITGAIGVTPTSVTAGTTPTLSANRNITYEYELCFKCHTSFVGPLPVDPLNAVNIPGMRYGDKAFEFNLNNSSFHPVETTGHSRKKALNDQFSASGSGLTINSTISCTDCHNNNVTSNANGWVVSSNTTSTTQAVGPHGSTFPRQLRANYETDYTNWNGLGTKGDLCFLCHDQSSITSQGSPESNFDDPGDRGGLHWKHLIDRSTAICKNCHFNPHSNQQLQTQNIQYEVIPAGTTTVYTYTNQVPPTNILPHSRLLNFSPDVGAGVGQPEPTWRINLGTRARTCRVICHGSADKMDPYTYTPTSDNDTDL